MPHLELTLARVPRYVLDQTRVSIATRRHGIEGQPWITADARAKLETLLRPSDRALEFGSGGSTEWLARHVGSLRSVEGFDRWHAPLAQRLAAHGIDNVQLLLVSAEKLGHQTEEHREAYVNAHPDVEPESLDVVFVDGEYRDDTALRGIELLRSGGLFVLDNSNTYLPSPTRTPWKVDAPASARWAQFLALVAGWRYFWTTNGNWDTTIWIKP